MGGRPKASFESAEPISSVSSSWTILTTCWPGSRPFSTSCAERALAHRRDELLDDLEVDVGLEQGQADLPRRARDGLLVEARAAAEVAEGVLEAVGERVEHVPGRVAGATGGIAAAPPRVIAARWRRRRQSSWGSSPRGPSRRQSVGRAWAAVGARAPLDRGTRVHAGQRDRAHALDRVHLDREQVVQLRDLGRRARPVAPHLESGHEPVVERLEGLLGAPDLGDLQRLTRSPPRRGDRSDRRVASRSRVPTTSS